MAAPVQDSASHPVVGAKPKTSLQHPISPLTAGEITESSTLIRQLWPENTKLQFKAVTLQEPNKVELMPFLAAEHEGKPTTSIDRRSFVLYYIRNTVSSSKISSKDRHANSFLSQDKLHEAIVNLTLGKVESNVRLGPNIHSNGDEDDIVAVEKLVLEDERVKAEIAKLQLPEGTVVVCDPWSYGRLLSLLI